MPHHFLNTFKIKWKIHSLFCNDVLLKEKKSYFWTMKRIHSGVFLTYYIQYWIQWNIHKNFRFIHTELSNYLRGFALIWFFKVNNSRYDIFPKRIKKWWYFLINHQVILVKFILIKNNIFIVKFTNTSLCSISYEIISNKSLQESENVI